MKTFKIPVIETVKRPGELAIKATSLGRAVTDARLLIKNDEVDSIDLDPSIDLEHHYFEIEEDELAEMIEGSSVGLRCSAQCGDSQDSPVFKAVVLVDETREVIDTIIPLQSAKEFRCAHCDAVAEEEMYYSLHDRQAGGFLGSGRNSLTEAECLEAGIRYLLSGEDEEDPPVDEILALSIEKRKHFLEASELEIRAHHTFMLEED